jgi:ESX secretion system protein EccE
MRGPHTLTHWLDPDTVSDVHIGLGHGGVVIGFRPNGEPVSVQLFRNRPTHVATICAGYTARVVAFRSIAVGAAVEVVSARTPMWRPLLDQRPDGGPAPVVTTGDRPPAGSPRRPLLRCEEVTSEALAPAPGLAAWQTRIVVPSAVSPAAIAGLPAFDLVLLRRVPVAAVHPVQLSLGLPDEVAAQLSRLPNDLVVAVADGQAMVLAFGLTPLEVSVLGPPSG